MLASRQGGMHGNQAGEPWKHSKAADKASLVLSMRQTQCERWPCHTHSGELWEAVSRASQGGCPGPPPAAAAFQEGGKIPPGSHSHRGWARQRNRPRLSLMFCDIPKWCVAGWNGSSLSGAGRWCVHAINSPAPSGRGSCTQFYTASIPTTVKVSCLMMHTALYLARGVISSLVRLLKNLKC